jgi:hypothetical protein
VKARVEYGIVTHETIGDIFDQRLLAADLLSRDSNKRTSHAAVMVRTTLEAVRDELLGMMA